MRRYTKLFHFLSVSCFFLIVVSLFRLVWFVIRFRQEAIQARITQIWAKILLVILGIRVEKFFYHHLLRENHFLIVSNHQSYIDVIVIASLFPALFVAKKEVKQWPLLGWLASLGGTVYIDRQAFRGGMHSAKEITSVLKRGVCVNIFPEGTSSDGTKVFPFKPSLLKSAIDSRASILPLSVNYLLTNGKPMNNESRDQVCWYGSMDFLPHFWNLLSVESVVAAVITHRVLTPTHNTTAQELAQQCFEVVSSGLIHVGNISPQQKILINEFSTAVI